MVIEFYDLDIWKLSINLSKLIYQLTKHFPKEEKYSLTSQIHESANSVSANIAEGYGRYHYKDRIKFLYNSRGSLQETYSHILLANELFNLPGDLVSEIITLIKLINKKINIYIKSINKNIPNPKSPVS